MNGVTSLGLPLWNLPLFAQESGTRTVYEFGREGWWPFIAGTLVALLLVGWIYRKDTQSLSFFWKFWLFSLRAAVLVAMLLIALDPQERVETKLTRNSHVAVLADTSVSMSFPEQTPASGAARNDPTARTRAQAVGDLLSKNGLIETLRGTHDVQLYTFDSQLRSHDLLPRTGAQAVAERPLPPTVFGTDWPLPTAFQAGLAGGLLAGVLLLIAGLLRLIRNPAALGVSLVAVLLGGAAAILTLTVRDAHAAYEARLTAFNSRQKTPAVGAATEIAVDWPKVLAPTGLESRLGEAVIQAVRDESGETLSGIIILSDGGNNAGIETSTAREAAEAAKARLMTIGTGSTERPVNLQVANVQAPTHVHLGDDFTITAFVQGQGLSGRNVTVELLSKLETQEGPLSVIATQETTLLDDGVPVAVPFDFKPDAPGRRIFNIRVSAASAVRELTEADNERALPPVEIVERRTRVLLFAGGPMRDYQFVRNLLYRDETIDVDVFLQTGVAGISQESNNLLFAFPATREELFEYDTIVCFDPKWEDLTPEVLGILGEWVFRQAGGLIFVAGEVYTGELASADEKFQLLRNLYPVVLHNSLFEFEFRNEEFLQPWPVEFTRAGMEAEFLQLTDNAATSAAVWNQFTGVYRSYPTGGPKAGATVYAYFSDPRSADENGKPVLLASQFYGAGRTMFIGSAEMWRLRYLGEEYYERLWVKLLREVGQGRLLRGTNRGVLLLERTTYPLGSTVQVRANLLDPQFQELVADQATLEVYDPTGKPFVPAIQLIGSASQPGQFHGAFSANLPGRYRLELPIPESKDQVVGYLQVELPNLEYDHPEQNDRLLQQLATANSGGKYFTIEQARTDLAATLPDRSTVKTQFDVPRPLWDQQWIMFALVGLLSLEWLTRKLLKLA